MRRGFQGAEHLLGRLVVGVVQLLPVVVRVRLLTEMLLLLMMLMMLVEVLVVVLVVR